MDKQLTWDNYAFNGRERRGNDSAKNWIAPVSYWTLYYSQIFF